ncbi:uncharacterized protein LOC106076908 isoform X1 [Biomphalaria glabrata]|uniref:Uncharacterized protein LOC106076908 isoform X1 n=2 Tax=Biomphalaria glabrata TaxID=6526 RepID=A0A9W3AQ89_BIOGL|nr:uncharacterized protein LOC106076908 isoform X1 [Biomphalaria glabrata]
MAFTARYYPNPNEDFVLLGGQPFYVREKPGFLSNSMLTDTTKNLTQHEYHSENYGDDPQLRGSLRTISRSLNRVSGDIRKTLLKDNAAELQKSYTQQELNETLRDALNRNLRPFTSLSQLDWYTKPIHLSSSVKIPMNEEDMLAARYFPVTLGESKSIEMVSELKPGVTKHSKMLDTNFKYSTEDLEQVHRQLRKSNGPSINDAYFLTAVAPNIKTAGITFTSPYSEELAKLRMEKLRIQEQQYLELKRQAELEKIRGPKPKWYELKTPDFHREANKNNTLLRNSDKWDELLQYRESLLSATNQLKAALEDYKVPVY